MTRPDLRVPRPVGFVHPARAALLAAVLLVPALPAFSVAKPAAAPKTAVLRKTNAPKPADYFPPPDSEGGWRTLKDAASIRRLAGMDAARLEQAGEFTGRCTQNAGLLVVRHGYLVLEKYFGRAQRNGNPDMASTGKAYTSIA